MIVRNVVVGKWFDARWHAQPQMFEVRNNFVTDDSRLVGKAAEGFRLPVESPAWKLGFKPIPFDQIGLRPDADRQRLDRLAR